MPNTLRRCPLAAIMAMPYTATSEEGSVLMLIESLYVENVQTFGTFDLQLDGATCVVVGPNGGGKSNVVRVLDLVQKALDSVGEGMRGPQFAEAARQVLQSFAAARHHGEPADRGAVVRLAIRLTTDAERRWMLTYFRAAALDSMLQELSVGDGRVRELLPRWVQEQITEERLTPLFSGTIVLRHTGLPQIPWEISYEFSYGNVAYWWVLNGPTVSRLITRAAPGSDAIRGTAQLRLSQCLIDVDWSHGTRPELPTQLPDFDFGKLCGSSEVSVTAPILHTGTGTFDVQFTPHRAAITELGIPSDFRGQNTFSLGYVLSALLSNGVIIIGEQLRGLGTGGAPPQSPGPYSWEALASLVRSYAPAQLPLRLFELKNGSSTQRRRFASIQENFTALAPGRTIDLTFRASALTPLDTAPIGAGQTTVFGPGEQGQPAAVITVTVDRAAPDDMHPNALPIQMHGAGTWEALVLAEALAEAPDRFVVLDEPAVTLHPSWQRALRSRIKQAEGQFLLITHSADLVAMEDGPDLERLVRVENETGQTRVHRFTPGDLDADEVRRITRDFALSADAVSLLFARAVVLLEGETELGALPQWFAECSTSGGLASPSDLDLAFWSVGSDTHFQPYITVLNALGIPWILICDGAVFDVEKRQKRSPHIFAQVTDGRTEAPELSALLGEFEAGQRHRTMNGELFEELKRKGAENGVFTLALGWKTADKTAGTPNDESFEAFIESVAPGKLYLAKAEVGDSKARRGRWLADNVSCPIEVSSLYGRLVAGLKRRGLQMK